MKKRCLAVLMAVCVALGTVIAPCDVSAAEIIDTVLEEESIEEIEEPSEAEPEAPLETEPGELPETEPEVPSETAAEIPAEEEFPTDGLLPVEELTVPEEEAEYFEETAEYSLRSSADDYGSEWEKYTNYYFYNQMNEAEREYWDALQVMCIQYTEQNTPGIAVKSGGVQTGKYRTELVKSNMGLSLQEMKQIARIFRYNNPQYYFLNNAIWSTSSAVGFGIYSAFAGTEDRKAATEQVKRQVDMWQAQIDACSTDVEKVKLIHDLIIEKVEYNHAINESGFDENTQYTQSAYSVFCTDSTVCAGYAQSFEMMCNGSGIDAVAVTSSNHEWNKVRINDSWYNVDCTWDDLNGTVYYTYFERNDAIFDKSSSHYEESFWEEYLPLCTLDSGASGYSPGTLPRITEQTAAPMITVDVLGGKYVLQIGSSTPGAQIYYTLDGSTPKVSGAKAYRYTGSFEITESMLLQAVAVCNGYWDSEAASKEVAVKKKYTVSFDGNGGTGTMESMEVYEGTGAYLPEAVFQRDGYHFTGWSTGADGKGTVYTDGAQIAGLSQSITLYAQWEINIYHITYELDGGENGQNPASYTYADSITLQEPGKTGYAFGGWYTDLGFYSPVAGIAAGSTGDKIFYAKWQPIRYHIVFSRNGGSGSMGEMIDLQYDREYSLPANTYKKTEYVFTGWNTKADGSGTSFSDGAAIQNLTAVPNGKITLYAQWAVKEYTITYRLGGGKNNKSNPASYKKSSATITLKNPTRTGYKFIGWYTDSKCTKKVTGIKNGSTGNKTFYAKWEAKKYTICFKENGSTSGKMSSLTSRKYGKSYQLTANKFKRTGYTFVGWNTKKDGSGTAFKNKAKVKNLTTKSGGKVVLYAQWKKTKYTITYKLKGGKNAAKNPDYYYYTTKTITLKKPTRKGHQFVGWYSDSKYKKKVTKIKKGSTGNITLYAKWKKK